MTGWIVTGSILAFLALLLSINLHINFSYREKQPLVEAGFWFFRFRLFPPKPKKEKKKKAVKKAEPAQKKDKQEPEPKKEKMDFEFILNLIGSGAKGLGTLLRHLRIKRLVLRIVVGDEDAAQCAIQYGKYCALVHGGLAAATNLVHLKAKEVSINCDFKRNETEIEAGALVGIRVVFVFGAAFRMLFHFVANTIKNNQSNRKV